MRIGPNPTRGCVDEVSFHAPLLSETEFRQHLPAVLPIHVLQGRVCIRRTTGRCCRNSFPDRSGPWKLTHQRIHGLSKKRGQSETDTVADTQRCIPTTVSLSDGRRLTGLRTTTVSKRGQLYLGWRWRKASGVVASRCSGETKQCRHDRSADEDDRDRRGAPGPLRQLLLCKRRNTSLLLEKFGRTSPVRGGFQNLQEKAGTMADVHIWGTMAHTYTNPARRPSTHKRHQGRHPRSLYLFSGEGRGRRRGRTAMCGDDGVDERRRRTA